MGILESIRKVFGREDQEIVKDAEEGHDPRAAEGREEARENIEGVQADQIADRRFGNLPSDDL
jgi:hypothetical protein